MVEMARVRQIKRLEEKGWIIDDECKRLAWGNIQFVGGPTFMKSPEGIVYAVSSGKETALDGEYPSLRGAFPDKLTQPVDIEIVQYTGGKRSE